MLCKETYILANTASFKSLPVFQIPRTVNIIPSICIPCIYTSKLEDGMMEAPAQSLVPLAATVPVNSTYDADAAARKAGDKEARVTRGRQDKGSCNFISVPLPGAPSVGCF
jgi:hypothetical protein